MNAFRRKELQRAIELIEQASEIIDNVMNDEQEALDNMPESLQYSERGEAMQEAIDNLSYLDSDFESLIESIQEVIEA